MLNHEEGSGGDNPLVISARLNFDGGRLVRPSPGVIERLTRQDRRIRYVPIDTISANLFPERWSFYTRIAEALKPAIDRDFADDTKIMTRGITVAIEEDKGSLFDSVANILLKGREGKARYAPNCRPLRTDGYVDNYIIDYMYRYTDLARRYGGTYFPALVVYRSETLTNWSITDPSERISAIYVTDSIVQDRQY